MIFRSWLLLLLVTSIPYSVYAAELAPDFTLPGRDQPIQLQSLRGKVVYVDFWASWCQPCRESFPWMNSLQKRYGDQGLVVIAVNLDKSRELSDKFLQQVPASFSIAYDPDGVVATAYHVKGMPSSYLIDRQGHIQNSHIGFRADSAEALEASIKTLVQQH
jgi:thiol-disulfide isomerase/thioredoxin